MNTVSHHGFTFSELERGEFVSLHYSADLSFAICTALTEYIPFETFKKIFTRISDFTHEYPMTHLAFDKRILRTFHQQSMEWYFTQWKPAVRANGLTSHYKILPEIDWFRESVSAGKNEILSKSGNELLDGISITYVESVDEAIDMAIRGNA